MGELWQTLLVNPSFNYLLLLYRITGTLGIAIIIFTVSLKILLIPVTAPSLKMSKKQRELQPELDEIKTKYKYDKKKQAELQMELFKKHGLNPATGCVTTIITLVLLIAVYQSVSMFTMGTDKKIDPKNKDAQLQQANSAELNKHVYFEKMKFFDNEKINRQFGYLDLAKPDPFLIVTILAVLTQFIATKMIMPYVNVETKLAKQTASKEDDIMAAVQKQNMYMMPLMFFVFGLTMPSGVLLYIVTSTVMQIAQTWYYSGWGGLTPWINKLKYQGQKVWTKKN